MSGLWKKREVIFWCFILAAVIAVAVFNAVKERGMSFQKQEDIYRACIVDNFAMCVLQNGRIANTEDARQCVRNLTTGRKWDSFEDICKSSANIPH